MQADIFQSVEGLNRTKRWRMGKFSLSLLKLRYPSSPALRYQSSRFRDLTTLGLTPSAPLLLRPLEPDWIISPVFLSLHVADCSSWDFLASINMWTNSYNKSSLICIYPYISYLFCFSGESCLTQLFNIYVF